MTNGINTKTDLELLIAKEASRRGLKLSDLESRPTLKGNALLKELDVLSNFTSKKTSEDHNLNELDKLSLEGSHKSGKAGQQPRAALNGVIGKSSKKNGAKGNEKLKEYDENDEEDNDESDSDSLSASSSSINNSRKNSRSNSPKVCLISSQSLYFKAGFVVVVVFVYSFPCWSHGCDPLLFLRDMRNLSQLTLDPVSFLNLKRRGCYGKRSIYYVSLGYEFLQNHKELNSGVCIVKVTTFNLRYP